MSASLGWPEETSPHRRANYRPQCRRAGRNIAIARAYTGAKRAMFTPAAVKPAVAMSVVESLDIRVGTIQAVDDVAGSRKLVRLTVGFGDHTRSILAGMKQERQDLQELVGRQALFIVNLEPRKMAGEISEGMLFDIGYADGVVPVLAMPERPVPDGTRAG
jgi:tRNA-binding protein